MSEEEDEIALGEFIFNTSMSASVLRYKKSFYQFIKITLKKGKSDQVKLLKRQLPEIINFVWGGN
jgi:hypothetical protein